MPKMDYSALRKRIRSEGHTLASLATEIGMAEATLCQKLNNNYAFDQRNIVSMCEVLHIEPENIGSYFFSPEC